MDLFEAMTDRRSVRAYTDEPVDDGDLERILEAGRAAASWANTQCWEIVLVTRPETKAALQETLSANNPARAAMIQAPVLFAACGRTGRSGFKQGQAATAYGDWLMFDVALFLANATHAAHALGYGTVHVGLFDHAAAAGILGLPGDVRVVELLPLGRPAGPVSPRPRKAVAEFLHRECWGG
jgi:nitroreductase